MLDAPLEATGLLVVLLEQRSIDDWVPLARWSGTLPHRLGDPDLVLGRVRELGVIEESVAQGCARCDRPRDDHTGADHDPEAQQAAVRLKPVALARLIAERFATAAGCSVDQLRPYAEAPSYVAEGVTGDDERFSFVVHMGMDRAGQPPDEAGRPLIVADVRGAPAMANPPALQASWIDLLDDAAARDRALAHVAALADTSIIRLQDIVEGLEHSLEPKDALAQYVTACGFTNQRGPSASSFVDQARLGSSITKWWRRDEELIVECGCRSLLGWHLHGYRRGRRTPPFVLEPRLQHWVSAAERTARDYRDLRARLARVIDTGPELLKDAAGLGTAFLTYLSVTHAGGLADFVGGLVTADQVSAVTTGLGLIATTWLLAPRLWKAWLAVLMIGVRWPVKPLTGAERPS